MGLSDTILEAYLWLIENYFDGDEIFVFGFSRGAFAARGFVGMLTNVGLARPESFGSIVDAYRISRLRAIQPAEAPAVRFRLEHSKDVKVHFLGVWETVGALGLSNWEVRLYESSVNYQLTLFKNIERFYQELAIDEHRFKFKPDLLVRARGNDKSEV